MPRKATEAEKAIAREIPAVVCTLCRVEKTRDAPEQTLAIVLSQTAMLVGGPS